MNERLIYEWLRENLKGKAWELREGICDWCDHPWGEAGYELPRKDGTSFMAYLSLPPLDMNTWHGEVVPKLKAQGVKVVFENDWWLTPAKYPPAFPAIVNPDPWLALTEYLEAVSA